MRVTEHLAEASSPLISFEIIPPKRGGHLQQLTRLIEALAEHKPPFIDITSHAAEVVYEETSDGIQRHVKRKRPGTMGVCALIQNKYNIDAVPHVLCNGFTQQETEDFMIELNYLGIDNVLAIRGDDTGYLKPLAHNRTRNNYASDLIAQIKSMNEGNYKEALLDAEPTNFCVGAAGYPEKHFEAPNLDTCVRRAKEKEEAGADYIVTQMFFSNAHFFTYVEKCREAGVTIPIIPGLKVLTNKKHLTRIPRTFHCELPREFSDEVDRAKDKADVFKVGVEWATQQSKELLEHGVPSVHFYVMQSSKAVNAVLSNLSR